MDAEASSSLVPFILVILAYVLWIVLVGILVPRILGRSLAFLANRFSNDVSHVSIPSLYIYPLSGRLVAHSVRYTISKGTISVEELVLQCRWWRSVNNVQFRQLPTVDDLQTLDPVAVQQQALETENAAFFAKRPWYRLRRWWRRTAVTVDPNNSTEPRPLISLICVGLRARIVNDEKNYAHVSKVLAHARVTERRSAECDDTAPTELGAQSSNEIDTSHPSLGSAGVHSSESSGSTYSSVDSLDSKPWQQRVLEVISLRISDGTFYFCDMGESPLVRLTINSAKLRYRYGAAACPADECRKRIRVRVSGLKLSVSSKEAVEGVVRMPNGPQDKSKDAGVDSEEQREPEESTTDQLIHRILRRGYKGFNVPYAKANSHSDRVSHRASESSGRGQGVLTRLKTLYTGRERLKRARTSQVMPCSEVVNATTAVIDYVFDEPGLERPSKEIDRDQVDVSNRQEGSFDASEKLPAPVCRISILFKGLTFAYDFQAAADIERVMERLQPVFYDLRSLARKVRSGEAKRAADGIQIEIEATPKTSEDKEHPDSTSPPIVSLPFVPKPRTWRGLLEMKVRNWQDKSGTFGTQEKEEVDPPDSKLSVFSSGITFRTEVPYQVGVAQKSVLHLKDVAVNAEGVVRMPLGSSKTVSVTRIIHFPVFWNDEHVVTSDVQVSDAEFLYFPDTLRILDDINTTIESSSRKPESVRYFVPFRETTKISAVQGYRIILSCSHNNAWRDIHAGEPDQYGRMIVRGEEGELLLSPSTATEFIQGSVMLSWSLSLPRATGVLEFSLSECLIGEKSHGNSCIEVGEPDTAQSVNLNQKTRASSLAQLVKTFETLAGHSHHPSTPEKSHSNRRLGIELLRVGQSCKLSGKVTQHTGKVFMEEEANAFLDSANRNDIHVKLSSLQLDLNPHHVTHILNFIRNYTGTGVHTLSATEESHLRIRRSNIASSLLKEGRFPTSKECTIMGLPAGVALSSQEDRTALDDLLQVSFQIDQVLVRMHHQPHVLAIVDKKKNDACSIECWKLQGSLFSNRLGLEFFCTPDEDENIIYFREGYLDLRDSIPERIRPVHEERKVPPTATISNLRITKKNSADLNWGPFYSEFKIFIDDVSGCISDTSLALMARFASLLVPDALHEDSLAVAAMLCIENIEVQVNELDLLVLSASSALSADRSGQMSKPVPSDGSIREKRLSVLADAPKFLTGIWQLQLSSGFRVAFSNLASENLATRLRAFFPDIAVDVLMPWGGKLIPWVDDVTIRAQVAHATFLRQIGAKDGFPDMALLRRVAEVREVTIDFNYGARPLLWSTRVTKQQSVHIARMGSQNSLDPSQPPSIISHEERERQRSLPSIRNDQQPSLKDFLDGGRRASSIEKNISRKTKTPHHLDYFSVSVLTNVVVSIAPGSLELVNDILVRSREAIAAQIAHMSSNSTRAERGAQAGFDMSDVMHLWHEFETTRTIPTPIDENFKSSTSMKAMETAGLAIMLTSPLVSGRERDRDTLFSSRCDTDEVEISASSGMKVLHLTKTDRKQPDHVAESLKTTKACVNHVSLPCLQVKCNGQELTCLSGIVFISRQTVKAGLEKNEITGREVVAKQLRNSLVGRVSSFRIGSKSSALHSYACLGRVLSIFVLLFRVLRLEASELWNSRRGRFEQLCQVFFSSSIQDLKNGEPRAVRIFLVQALQYLRSSEREHTIALEGASTPNQFQVPSDILRKPAARIETTSQFVLSIDASIRNFSLKTADLAIIDGDFFQCKGGFRSNSGSNSPHLDGYVFNASFGTIRLSLRDDTTSDVLRMVSEVASFVQIVAFSIPIIRQDTIWKEHKNIDSSEMSPFSSRNENVQRGKRNDVLEASPTPATRTGRSFWGSSLGGTRQRFADLGRQPSLGRSRTSFGRTRMIGSGARCKSERSARFSWLRSRDPESPSLSHQHVPESKPPLDDQANLSIKEDQETGKRKKNLSKAVPLDSLGCPSNEDMNMFPENEDANPAQPSHLQDGETWDEEVTKDERYTYVAVRTAGESGPPRKRAKSMVRVDPFVPPAFMNPHDLARPRQTASRNHLEPTMTPKNISSNHGKDQFIGSGSNPSRSKPRFTRSEGNNSTLDIMSSNDGQMKKEVSSSVTLFVSCHRIACHYFRGETLQASIHARAGQEADVRLLISDPRLTYMCSPQKGSHSVVITSSCAELQSGNDPSCILTGSIKKTGLTMSLAQSYVPSSLPKLIMSAQLSQFTTTLHATDLQSVLTFRESFKRDIKGILSAFVRTKQSISEVARVTRLSSANTQDLSRTVYSTLAFDLLCEKSQITLEGFHPKDSEMKISYLMDGMFFSIVASEDDSAALTLGLRLYGHGLCLASPSWESVEKLHFPSLDARGVQWGEATGLPTILKVTAEPLVNSTSVQGLRHVLFTVTGLMAFQNATLDATDAKATDTSSGFFPRSLNATTTKTSESNVQASGTPFTRSFAAWERTKGVRMDLSIRPMSLSLVSGQVLALFDVDTITGIFEWNKLVQVGVQLHMAVSVQRISLSFMRMPSSQFTIADIRPNEKRTSLSIALERSRIDLLKTQEDLTHTFTFRIDVFAVSGECRPWKLMLDAASWADEQEFVAELQAINYSSVSSGKQRLQRVGTSSETQDPMQHRVILVGASVQRVIMAIPLVSIEENSSSRLALRATELLCLSRQRPHNSSPRMRSVMQLKIKFIGILWENSPLLSTHHARIAFSVNRPSLGSNAHCGATSVVMYPGSWRICPRKDVIIAILEAKNRKDNKRASEKTRELLAALPEMSSYPPSSTAGESTSYATDRQSRLLFESLSLKTFRTSGFIEGLERSTQQETSPSGPTSPLSGQSQRFSKLSVPAFTVSLVRSMNQKFDLIDIDFSGREGGEFPRGCLGKVSHLFSDLFGVVTADQMDHSKKEASNYIQNSREMTRDVSVLIRFGKSLYRAQEEVNASMEAKFGFFAGKSSSLLISLFTESMSDDEGGQTTIITGISPRLGLEITPLLSGAQVQSLRLTNARFLHGITPSLPSHTLMHINRVTALMEAKTLLLTRNRLGSQPSVKSNASDDGSVQRISSSVMSAERKVMLLFGKGNVKRKSVNSDISSKGAEYRVEPDIRLQMKFPANDDSQGDELDLFVERCILGTGSDRSRAIPNSNWLNGYAGFHKVILRARWDMLGCKLQLREALLCYDALEAQNQKGKVSLATIINRLQFESMQYGRDTAKVDIDAVAAMWSIPAYEMLVESTSIHAEIAYTMQNAKAKLSGQAKKLKNEVKLLTEKDLSREPKRGNRLSYESTKLELIMNGQDAHQDMERSHDGLSRTSGSKSLRSGETIESLSTQLVRPRSRKITVKGDELVVIMRGYQFDEARQSAEVALTRYNLDYRRGFSSQGEEMDRNLNIDFYGTRLSYVDEDRMINSDLFRIRNPKLCLSIIEREDIIHADLQGVLLIALEHGFYYTRDFRNLTELTLMGIEHMPAPDQGEPSQKTKEDNEDKIQVWDGKEARVTVNLNPKIDVMGDLTEDLMKVISSRLGKVEVIPKQMYDFIIVPLESISNTLCDPLDR